MKNKTNDDYMNHDMLSYFERDLFASTEDNNIFECFQSMRSCNGQIPCVASGKSLSYQYKLICHVYVHNSFLFLHIMFGKKSSLEGQVSTMVIFEITTHGFEDKYLGLPVP